MKTFSILVLNVFKCSCANIITFKIVLESFCMNNILLYRFQKIEHELFPYQKIFQNMINRLISMLKLIAFQCS